MMKENGNEKQMQYQVEWATKKYKMSKCKSVAAVVCIECNDVGLKLSLIPETFNNYMVMVFVLSKYILNRYRLTIKHKEKHC